MEKAILNIFTYNDKLKFNEIEKLLEIRSNKLAYHIKNLVRKGILTKYNETYFISESCENIIPYLSEKKSILPVILIYMGSKEKVFLKKRKKLPFKDHLSLPGGRMILGESIAKATERILKEKDSINAKLKHIHSISLEHVKKNNKIIHSFLLIFVSAKTQDKIEYTDINQNKKKIISSDYNLIKNSLNKKIIINSIITKI